MPGFSFFLRFSTNFSETETESFLVSLSSLVAFSGVSGHFKGVFRIFENLLPSIRDIWHDIREITLYSLASSSGNLDFI